MITKSCRDLYKAKRGISHSYRSCLSSCPPAGTSVFSMPLQKAGCTVSCREAISRRFSRAFAHAAALTRKRITYDGITRSASSTYLKRRFSSYIIWYEGPEIFFLQDIRYDVSPSRDKPRCHRICIQIGLLIENWIISKLMRRRGRLAKCCRYYQKEMLTIVQWH